MNTTPPVHTSIFVVVPCCNCEKLTRQRVSIRLEQMPPFERPLLSCEMIETWDCTSCDAPNKINEDLELDIWPEVR